MIRARWTPNVLGSVLLVWGTLWLAGRYLYWLKCADFIPGTLKIFIWIAGFFATPFAIWRFYELLFEIFYTIYDKCKFKR